MLCSTFQNGCSSWVFWVNLKWDSFAWPCLDWSTWPFTNFQEKILIFHFVRSLPRPRYRPVFELFFIWNLLCAERISKKSNVAKYAPNGELTTPALSDDTRLNLREKTINYTRMLQKPNRTYWAQIRVIVTISFPTWGRLKCGETFTRRIVYLHSKFEILILREIIG